MEKGVLIIIRFVSVVMVKLTYKKFKSILLDDEMFN